MAIKELRTPSTNDPVLTDLITALRDFTRPLTQNPQLDGIDLKGVVLTTSGVDVPHRLGRPWVGWMITDKNAAADIFSVGRQRDNLFIRLQSTAPVTVNIRVF